MLLRVLILDHKPLAGEQLRELLETEPNVKLMGVCTDCRKALATIRQNPPDLVFVEVRMPGRDGFAFVKALPPGPLVVVVTACDKYAVRAFEAEALDYLLKPCNRKRLRQTLRRARQWFQAIRASQNRDRSAPRGDRLVKPRTPTDRILVKESDGAVFVGLDEIDWIGAAENYAELHTGNTSRLLRSTLGALQSRLASTQFVRISRSALVNLQRVKEVRFHRYGNGTVILQDGSKLALSRSHRHRLKQLLDAPSGRTPFK